MSTEAEITCGCGSNQFAITQPLTDDSEVTCKGCGATSTYGEMMDQASDRVADEITKQLKKGLGGIDGVSLD